MAWDPQGLGLQGHLAPMLASWRGLGPPLASLGLPWSSPWLPLASPWPPFGCPLAPLGVPLASLWPPLAPPWRTFGVILASRINGQVRKNKGSEKIWALAPIGALRRSNKANTESTVIQNAIEIWIDRVERRTTPFRIKSGFSFEDARFSAHLVI